MDVIKIKMVQVGEETLYEECLFFVYFIRFEIFQLFHLDE